MVVRVGGVGMVGAWYIGILGTVAVGRIVVRRGRKGLVGRIVKELRVCLWLR